MKSSRQGEYEILGAIIGRARNAAGLSQRELARILGRTPTSIHKIERGSQGTDLSELLDIAVALGVKLEDIAAEFSATAQASSRRP